MILDEIKQYSPVTIQCHDNPDADTIGAAYALHEYFKTNGIPVRMIYSGRHQVTKPNLVMILDSYKIPLEYVEPDQGGENSFFPGILITVDCQYGAGNVTQFKAEAYAEIDHHKPEGEPCEYSDIRSNLGSCSTLVWNLLKEKEFSFAQRRDVGTALYFGLFMDTNQFSEMSSPYDLDMRESIPCDQKMIVRLKNSNLSIKELEIAGVAMLRYVYNRDYRYAIIQSQPCDTNVLGLISDFVLQVNEIDASIVFATLDDGYKYSVRSCIKEIKANELADFLAGTMGSGGGHEEKAGGFISLKKYQKQYPALPPEAFFSEYMNRYYEAYDVLNLSEHPLEIETMQPAIRCRVNAGVVDMTRLFAVGTSIVLRTSAGDVDYTIEKDKVFVIMDENSIYLIDRKYFDECFDMLFIPYTLNVDYRPVVKNRQTGEALDLCTYATTAIAKNEVPVYVRKLTKGLKLFTKGDPDSYKLGQKGDYLVANMNNLDETFIVTYDDFEKRYRYEKEN